MTDRERRLASLSPAKRELLERQRERRRQQLGERRREPIPARAPSDAPIPLSSSQERFWFLQQLEPNSTESNVYAAGRFVGPFQRDAMQRALGDLVQRHEILRASFPAVDGVPTQRIAANLHVPLTYVDLSRRGAAREAAAEAEAKRFCAIPFDLASGPLLRACLLRLAPEEHVLIVLQHHIVCDGWSLGVLGRELAQIYAAHVRRVAPQLPAPAIQFPDYACWERARMTGEHLERELGFWSERLAGAPPALQLPIDHPRPALQTHAGNTVVLGLGASLSEELRSFAAAQGTTLFVTMLAAFDAFLARICGETDVVVGTSIANRDRPELEALLGPLANTLALRLDCAGSPSFTELLARARRATAEAFAHPDLPFERLVEELGVERDPGCSPIFNVFFDMGVPFDAAPYEGLEARPYSFDHERALFDLALSIFDGEREVNGALEFNTDLFERATIDRLWRSFRVLLQGMLDAPDSAYDALPLLDADDRQHVLLDFNATELALQQNSFVHRRFEERARERPDAPALEHAGVPLSYAELERRANRLAHHLIARGVGREVRVAVRLPRSVDVIVAILAIWKAGGAYVPIDPEDPKERQRVLLEASDAALLITRGELGPAPAANTSATPRVLLDEQAELIASHADDAPRRPMASDDLAYVIFTSGSTGRPKGVAVPQGALLNHVAWVRDAFDITPRDRFLLRTPLTFDASLWEIVHPLVSGSCLVVAPPDVQRDPALLLELVGRARITILQTVPSMLVSWLESPRFSDCTALRHLICAGESLRLDLVHGFDRRCAADGLGAVLHNLYGPSEACIDASAHSCRRGPDGLTLNGGRETLPIGRPISNFQLYVLDAARQPVPIGVTGELYVGGAGLARGYLDQPEQTAERFVSNPFGAGRLYRTGDLGRYLPDGRLEYVGRRDQQVKVRGHRIELGEVEVVLAAHPGVKEAVVVTDGPDGNARLLAYYTRVETESEVSPAELRAFLGERLPRHMLPSLFVALPTMPLTASEKVDRRALPAPTGERGDAEAPSVAPRTPTEERLAALMAELLECKRVGVHDDFFALGGHSLLATRLASRVRAEWAVDVPLLRFFETPTVAALARAVEASVLEAAEATEANESEANTAERDTPLEAAAASGATETQERPGELPLSFAQQRLWFLARLEPDATLFNMPGAVRLAGALDADALGAAYMQLVARHEVLRTIFREREGRPHGVLRAAPERMLERVDLSTLAPAAQEARIRETLELEARHVFDLSKGPLLRATLLRLGETEHSLVFNQHHIISDAWSLGVMVSELGAFYAAACRAEAPALPELAWQYVDFARWQRAQLSGARLDELLGYWRSALRDAPPTLELPFDRPRPARPLHAGRTARRELPRALVDAARAVARTNDTTLFVVLLTAFDALLHRVTRAEDIVVATAVANRTRLETEALVGFFINTVALRVDVSGGPSFAELLARVQRSAHGAFAHQDLPFERLVDELAGARDPSRPPLANVSFNLLSADDLGWRLGDLAVEPLPFDAGGAKLDLGVTLIDDGELLVAELEFDTGLFEAETIQRLWDAYLELLGAGLAEPTRPLATLPLLSDAARARVLASSRGPEFERVELATIDELVARHARRAPEVEALVCGEERLGYGQLEDRVEALAVRLRALGVGPNELVGLCLPRGVDLVVALLASWRADGAWVPVLPSDPPARRRQLLADAGARVLLTHAELASEMAGSAPRVLLLDETDDATEAEADDARDATAKSDDLDRLAYVLFTSGSTGRPKGVEVSQRALSHHMVWFLDHLEAGPDDRVLQKIPLSFDAALLELLTPLAAGGALILVDDAQAGDPAELLQVGARERITLLGGVPSLMRVLIEHERFGALSDLRAAYCGGERLSAELVTRFHERCASFGRKATLSNLYGPTETCIDATTARCPPDAVDPVPIGRPITGARAYVVDEELRLLPELVPGELLVAGTGVARGYRRLPEADAAAFVADPFEPGERAYRTGDLVRRRADGELIYLGRLDAQLKVRGQRVEPGEVESVLGEHPEVTELGVSCADGLTLVAHVVRGEAREHAAEAGDERARAELTQFAGQRLPSALVPSVWSFVERLPRTTHGKLDRRALAELAPPTHAGASRAPSTPPRSPLEAQLVGLVAELLDAETVDVHDDFFARGGHSLLAIQLVARIAEALGVELPLREVFAGPTPAQMAVAVGMLQRGESLQSLESARAVDLAAEAQLDEDIRPSAPGSSHDTGRAQPREILLTGATGFLGAFLLRELIERTNARVSCLVRARDADQARARLVANMQRYELWEDRLGDAIVALPGDLGQPRLGLTREEYDALARDIDVVYHSGASVNFFHDYRQLEPANVGGTRELLRLACAGRTAAFHFVSTIGVLASPRALEHAELAEDVALEEFADLEGGYEQSKWVAEQLVHEAGRRGLPVAIYRPGRISGHSLTGVGNVDDVGGRVLRGCLELGSAPDIDAAVDMTPVDFVAAALAELSLGRLPDGRSYHLVNPERVALTDVFDWARAEGYPLRSVPWTDWLRELSRTVAKQPSSTLYPLLPLFAAEGADESDFAPDVKLPPLSCRHVHQDLTGASLHCPRVDRAMLSRWLANFARRGLLEPKSDENA